MGVGRGALGRLCIIAHPLRRLLARLLGNKTVVFYAAVARKVEDCFLAEQAIIQINLGDDQFIRFCFRDAKNFTVGVDYTTFAKSVKNHPK